MATCGVSPMGQFCPTCTAENGLSDSFCRSCGAALPGFCQSCGAPTHSSDGFCRRCGASLVGALVPHRNAHEVLRSLDESGGEHKRLSILFADLKDSTSLTSGDSAEEAMRRLAPVIATMKDAVHDFDGIVSAVLGDGVMALFGTPKPIEDHAIRACLAGLAIQEQIAKHNDTQIQIRVGIHTGEVVVQTVHASLTETFGAVGPAVHLASRIEHMAEPGSILISHATFREAGQFIQTEPLGPRPVRGLTKPVEVYRVTGLRNAPASEIFRNRGPLEPLIGRTHHVRQLQAALEKAERGKASIIGVVGDAGIGKSRLCYEFVEHCRRKNIAVLEARVAPFGRSTPFQPILDLLRDYFGVQHSDDQNAVRTKITEQLHVIEGGDAIAPILFDFMGLTPGAKGDQTDSSRRKAQLIDFVCNLLQRGSVRGPAVVLIEDLHWLDSGSESFIEAMAEAVYGTRTLLLLNFRTGFLAPWMQQSHYSQINLDPLDEADADALIAHAVGAHRSTEGLRRELAMRAQGNPFFLEELIRALIELGGLSGAHGAFQASGKVNLSTLPPTVQGVLEARINKLDPMSKRLLQVAAVIGREIPLAVLTEVSALNIGELNRSLRQLRRSELLYEMPFSARGSLAFRHPLVQEVAYHGLLTDRRRSLHGAVAKSILTVFGNRLDEFAALLGFHLEEAGDLLGAAQAHTKSAIWVGANDARQALAAWRKVCQILDRNPTQKGTELMRMMACGQVVNFAWREGIPAEEARPYFERASAIAVGLKDKRANALIHAAYGRILGAAGSADDYVSKIREAQSFAETSTDKSLSVTLSAVLCHALRLSGRLMEALAVNKVGLDHAAELAKFERQMLGFDISPWLIAMRGQTLVMLGRGEEARTFLDRVIQMETGQVDATHHLIPSLAYVDWAWATGDIQLAEIHSVRAIDIAEKAGNPYIQVYARSSRALALWVLNRRNESIALWTDTLAFARNSKAGLENESRMVADIANAYFIVGELDLAIGHAREAISIARDRRARVFEGYAHIVLGNAQATLGDCLAAEATHGKARRLLEETGARLFDSQFRKSRSIAVDPECKRVGG
jgi:class 3 adenylate cyclase/tetratricopeptide (TPR) repeat protein